MLGYLRDPCWNGKKVRFALVLHTCDREAFFCVGTTTGITGEPIRYLIVEAMKAVFGATAIPNAVERLTDNSSRYMDGNIVEQAYALDMIPCFTPIPNPESNAFAEAFVNTLKRNYLYLHDRPYPRTILALLHHWFQDYNDVHPHKGLKMRSPTEFIRSQSALAWCASNQGVFQARLRNVFRFPWLPTAHH